MKEINDVVFIFAPSFDYFSAFFTAAITPIMSKPINVPKVKDSRNIITISPSAGVSLNTTPKKWNILFLTGQSINEKAVKDIGFVAIRISLSGKVLLNTQAEVSPYANRTISKKYIEKAETTIFANKT